MNKCTPQELRGWAESIAVGNYGKMVSRKFIRETVLRNANTQERARGFTREDIRQITDLVNKIHMG